MSLESIRARVEKATEGPWRREISRWLGGEERRVIAALKKRQIAQIGVAGCRFGLQDQHNADFVAHARQDIPALLEVAEAAKGCLKAARMVLRESRPGTLARLELFAEDLAAALDELEAME
jgi:hypothetical protein